MKYLDLIKPNIDSFELIAESESHNRDGGDTFQREGMFMFGAWMLHKLKLMPKEDYEEIKNRYKKSCEKLQVSWGNYKRHTDPNMWYSDPDRMSRDQAIPNMISWGVMDKLRLLKFFTEHLFKRALLFTTNTRDNWSWKPGHPQHKPEEYKWKLPDITFVGVWAYYIRGMGWLGLPLYPLLLVCDLDLVANAIAKLFYGKNPKNSDDLNFICSLVYALARMPTPLAWIAKKIYQKRPKAEDTQGYKEDFGPQTALNHYFRFNQSGPLLNKVYKPILDIMLK